MRRLHHSTEILRMIGAFVALAVGLTPACKRTSAPADEPDAAGFATTTSEPVSSVVPSATSDSEPDLAPSIPKTADESAQVSSEYAWLPARTVTAGSPHKIAAKAMQAWVHQYPDDETPYLGYIRAGRIVDRSESWIAKTVRCPDGWYEVLPEGYICRGNRATLDMNDPVVVASWKQPRRGEPLPYRYVRPASLQTYLYFTLPSKK
ncbi:MAG TPA: hypothetical protein PLM08_05635, partial [Polyangiaceae bacterium]|nr:hypothetical protein [Polyangiaceae bacterium]